MKILFSGGGTMGPVTPLLAVAEELRDHEILWIGTRRGPEREIVEAAGIRFRAIASGKLRRYFDWRTLADIFLIKIGFIQSLVLILRWRPDVIVSAGGYVSVPLVWAGWLLGVPSVVHQQDLRPLLAVRLMAPFARKITAAFPKTAEKLPKAEAIGNPVRRFVEKARENRERLRSEGLKHFGLSADRPVVLVFGGGTGSKSLNDFVAATRDNLLASAQVIHITGKRPFDKLRVTTGVMVSSSNHDRPSGYVQREFLTDELALAYTVADLAVSRAGMGAISELSAVGLPTILVPIPSSHQEANAKYLEDRQAAVVVREGPDFHRDLLNQIRTLLSDPGRRVDLSKAIHGLLPISARARFANIIQGVASGK